MSAPRLASLSTTELAALVAPGQPPLVVLVPCGSVEPHGPHLPLETDTLISEAAIARAAQLLSAHCAVTVAPAVAYGVTEYARGFAGAISIPARTLTLYLRAIVDGLHAFGAQHVCLVNNHLEPAHDAAVRAAILDLPRQGASVACPLDRRWARRLSEEFRRGECHAGRYETSIVLAAAPDRLRLPEEQRRELPEILISLSQQIKAGVHDFIEMGLADAYAGAPALAGADEGHAQLDLLAEMIATEVREAMGLSTS